MRSVALILVLAFVAAACGDSGGRDAGRFCEILDEIDAQNTTGLPPEEALPIIEDGRAKFVEGKDVAPDEIRADAETFADGALQITDVLIAAGGDETAVDPVEIETLAESIFTPEYDAAAQRVTVWRGANCS